MTEEIIIDGVDVAGCEYYKGKCMEYTHYCQIGCKECTDIGTKLCHYKQTERFKAKIESLEQENRELKAYKDVNEDFKKAWDELNKKYTEVLKLAKENADSNEYCLQELEQKYEQLRSALEEIRSYCKSCENGVNARKIKEYINEVLNLS